MTPNERLERQMRFLVEADKLKAILRQNTLADGSRRENDAEHSWHFALMALVLAEHAAQAGIDAFKVVKMALIHDLVEIDAGDVFLYDEAKRAGQAEAERAAAERLFGLLPPGQAADLRALWEEFEAAATPEARFAKAVDRLGPLTLNYHAQGVMWKRHGLTDAPVRRLNRRGIEPGSPTLWACAEAMIDDAVRQGNLRPDAGEEKNEALMNKKAHNEQ
jgi:putative hydrolase of HD superfamily